MKLSSLTHLIITQLDSKVVPALELLLARRQAAIAAGASAAPLQVVLSNPALRLVQTSLGERRHRVECTGRGVNNAPRHTITARRGGEETPFGGKVRLGRECGGCAVPRVATATPSPPLNKPPSAPTPSERGPNPRLNRLTCPTRRKAG